MESPRKFNDCYFYYYSTCTKGDNCVFRHEPSALGCETMCSAWQQGKCLDKRCKLRHMELRKNRKQIPCYWENQPGGCRKIHCPFMHKNPEARTDGIAPSQPIQPQSGVPSSVNVQEPVPEQPPMNPGVPTAVPAPQPVPLLWQQQRQGTSWRPTYNLPSQELVLDSAILGVLPGGRVLPPHEAQPNPYVHGPLPVDPLVVNFEEESDNESAPSSTPTKVSPEDALKIAKKKAQELLMLEKIQAEAAAYYNYDLLPPVETKRDRKIVRTNLAAKYERQPSDEGKFSTERRSSLDFKVLSLDEIRARKKNGAIIQNTPITINLSRKRKLSTQETVTTTGNKIIKVVSSKSIVYKKLDSNALAVSDQGKVDQKQNDNLNRKRKLSTQNDIVERENELVDNCFEFKRIKLTEPNTAKPKLNRNSSFKSNDEQTSIETVSDKANSDSDTEVEIVGVDLKDNLVDTVDLSDTDDADVDTTTNKLGEPIVVDLSEDSDEITLSDIDLDLKKNVPDVVASCHLQSSKLDSSEDYIHDIDSLLNDS